jgi:hypothetical protein
MDVSLFLELEEKLALFRQIHKLKARVGNANLQRPRGLGFEKPQVWRKARQAHALQKSMVMADR